jgi:hypothetical protein
MRLNNPMAGRVSPVSAREEAPVPGAAVVPTGLTWCRRTGWPVRAKNGVIRSYGTRVNSFRSLDPAAAFD